MLKKLKPLLSPVMGGTNKETPEIVMPESHSLFLFPLRAFIAFLLWLILVPQHLLPTLALLFWYAVRYIGMQRTLGFILIYVAWMGATNTWKHRAGDVAPQWMCRFIRWCLHSCLDLLGCKRTIIMEYSPPDGGHDRRYVCCYNPHGAFATAGICYAMAEFRLHKNMRKLDGSLCGASALFYVPFVREILLILGVRDASKKTMQALLAANRSIGMQPGGIWEQLHTDHKKEQCFCMRKLGFMRLALEHGMPIIVVYAFGESQLYTTYPWAYNLRRWIAQNFYLGIPLITGRFGLPFPIIPHATPITIVSGSPIEVGPPNPNPTAADLKVVYEKYEAELHRLFNKYGKKSLPPDVFNQGFTLRWRASDE